MKAASDLQELLRTMEPVLNDGVYFFASLPPATDVRSLAPVATIHEAEGLTVVVREGVAESAGVAGSFRAAWITLGVHSDLHAVGLTAAFSQALTAANVGCNVLAGVNHDHIFVPVEQADRAMAALRSLQQRAEGVTVWLLLIALVGLVVPNGLFLYWYIFEFTAWQAVAENTLALAFMIDAFMAVGLLAIYFARRPIGPVRWPWFVILSLFGGLGFSLPLYYWLNRRTADKS